MTQSRKNPGILCSHHSAASRRAWDCSRPSIGVGSGLRSDATPRRKASRCRRGRDRAYWLPIVSSNISTAAMLSTPIHTPPAAAPPGDGPNQGSYVKREHILKATSYRTQGANLIRGGPVALLVAANLYRHHGNYVQPHGWA